MQYAIAASNASAFGHPEQAVELATLAEDAGWDGYFTWDSLLVGENPRPTYDPWVLLAAIASATERIRIGTCVAVVPRYRPHLLAMTLASLDVLSKGRMIFGVGLGSTVGNFEVFGEAEHAKVRAERLDEALEVITALWSGEAVNHRGAHYTVDGFALTARPLQRPRIPIWVGGDSAAAKARAARWDGWIGPDLDPGSTTPVDVRVVREQVEAAGADLDAFTIAWGGRTTPADAPRTERFGAAGAGWWIEMATGDPDTVRRRVAAGPLGQARP